MTMTVKLIKRRIRISIKECLANKFLTLCAADHDGAVKTESGFACGDVLKQGWVVSTDLKWLERFVDVPQLCETEHDNGGPPDVGTPTLTVLLAGIESLVTAHNVSPTDVADLLNNAVYLAANAKNKPRASSTMEEIRRLFALAATKDPLLMQTFFANAMGKPDENAWLRQWYATTSPIAP